MAQEQMISRKEWGKKCKDYLEEDKKHVGEISSPDYYHKTPYGHPLVRSLVTEELIRHYARGAMGDPDPLYIDPAYGRHTRWGTMIAPPSFARAIGEPGYWPRQSNLPGWAIFYGGTQYNQYKTIRPGDRFHIIDKYLGYVDKSRPGAIYKLYEHLSERTYLNERDEVMVKAIGNEITTVTYPSDIAKYQQNQYANRKRRRYTKKELDDLHRHYEDELAGKFRRGENIRYWEDVTVGEAMPTIIKGPLSIGDAVAWMGGCGGAVYGSFAVSWDSLRHDLGHAPVDRETGEYHQAIVWHYLDEIAQQSGLPYAHSFGAQNEANIAHSVANWMGDDGFCTKLYLQHRAVNFFGDMNFVNGKVLKKYVENGQHLVDLDMATTTQDGIVVTKGTVTVRLVSRED